MVTDDRRAYNISDGLMFDLCHLEALPSDPSVPRRPWIAMAHEAPPSTRTQILADERRMSTIFNFSSTFRSDSDISVRNIMQFNRGNLRPLLPWSEKTELVAYFASNCA